MKYLVISIMAIMSASAAHADGFVCQTGDGDLTVKAFNKTHASEGTRNAAVMVLSDNTADQGNQTIARFTNTQGLVSNSGASYSAKVDLRFNNVDVASDNVDGTQLGLINTIDLDVDFSYAEPLNAGDSTTGVLTLNKRNGEVTRLDLTCTRYLKQ